MKRAFSILLIITCLISYGSSCRREGCMDKNACNYDSKAEKDDGTCNYGCNKTNSECTNGERRFYDILAQKNINCFDYTPGSPYYNSVFTMLTLTQNRFQTCVDGTYQLAGYTENIIKFKNITAKTGETDHTKPEQTDHLFSWRDF